MGECESWYMSIRTASVAHSKDERLASRALSAVRASGQWGCAISVWSQDARYAAISPGAPARTAKRCAQLTMHDLRHQIVASTPEGRQIVASCSLSSTKSDVDICTSKVYCSPSADIIVRLLS